ncbi:MAG: hypothetical protein ACXV8O_15725 [Methylobacter sp.]
MASSFNNDSESPEMSQDASNAKQELPSNDTILRLITENVDDLIVLLDTRGRCLYNSPSYQRILADGSGRPVDSFQFILATARMLNAFFRK